MAFLTALIEAFPDAVHQRIKYHNALQRVKTVRMRTALEMCICSNYCDGPSLRLLLQWHCRLVGASKTFLGRDREVCEQGTSQPESSTRFATLVHWALRAKAKSWLIEALVTSAEEFGLIEAVCSTQDETGCTPLHVAICMNMPMAVIELLLVRSAVWIFGAAFVVHVVLIRTSALYYCNAEKVPCGHGACR